MLRLLYSSDAAPDLSAEQVRDILHTARKHNAAVGLTGVLVGGGRVFLQILEGPEQAVLRTYVKILDDRRHGNCRLIYISPASGRVFSNWAMGWIDSKPLEFQHLTQLVAARRETVEDTAFTAVMSEFLQRLRAVK
jgi:hypothetical protein